MKKIISLVLAMVMVFAISIPAFAAAKVTAPANPINGNVTVINKNVFDSFAGTKFSANNDVVGLDGMSLISDSKAGWWLRVTENLKGSIKVAYKISSNYYIAAFDINGTGDYWIGDGSGKNGVNMVKVGEFEAAKVDPVEDNTEYHIGFIGYYDNNGNVLSTSFYWQTLKAGGTIDWVAVEDAYAAWHAQGGYALPGNGWQTSGVRSTSFAETRPNFVIDKQLQADWSESYYKAIYFDPGYEKVKTSEQIAYLKYRAYVKLWNDLWIKHGGTRDADAITKALYVEGINHYNALLTAYNVGSLPPYFSFEDYSHQESWADKLEPGLVFAVGAEYNLSPEASAEYLAQYVITFGDVID